MKNGKLITENVYSSIDDDFIKQNLKKSPIFKNCHKEEEFKANKKGILKTHTKMFCYTIKFDGTVPVQLTKVEKIK